MNGRYLLDTNIVIAIMAGDRRVLDKLATAAEISIPSIVVGELFFGAYCSQRMEENLNRIIQFVDKCAVIDCNQQTARHYGYIKSQLKTRGRPIPENDIWIAALALQHSFTLVSRDQHFGEIEGLPISRW